MVGSNNYRLLLDRYIYDYLRKKNMHNVAEIFSEEAKLNFDSEAPPAIDEPDGFLHEWWSVFYDMFCAYQSQRLNQQQDPTVMAENGMEAGQQSSGKLKTNENTMVHSQPSNESDQIKSLASINGISYETQSNPQGFPVSWRQREMLSSGYVRNPPHQLANSCIHEAGSSSHAAFGMSDVAPNEGPDLQDSTFRPNTQFW